MGNEGQQPQCPSFSNTEKFIAFFDVLGWKYLVRASEEGRMFV